MFFGEKLKESREKQGITIEEIVQETKIQKRYLVDIEEGNLSDLPGRTYIRGFLKSYAVTLKENPEEILNGYEEYCSLKEQKEKIVEKVEEGKHTKKGKKINSRKKNIILAFLILGIFYLITAIIMPLIQNKTKKTIKVKTEQSKKIEKIENKENKESELSRDKKNVISEEISKIKKIEITATGKSWLEIHQNEEIVFLGYIETGETKKIESAKKIFLKIGDASKVKIKYNDKDLGNLGKKNEVIKKEF